VVWAIFNYRRRDEVGCDWNQNQTTLAAEQSWQMCLVGNGLVHVDVDVDDDMA
jgi:hypothetical protein